MRTWNELSPHIKPRSTWTSRLSTSVSSVLIWCNEDFQPEVSYRLPLLKVKRKSMWSDWGLVKLRDRELALSKAPALFWKVLQDIMAATSSSQRAAIMKTFQRGEHRWRNSTIFSYMMKYFGLRDLMRCYRWGRMACARKSRMMMPSLSISIIRQETTILHIERTDGSSPLGGIALVAGLL